jgi:hypothetical protein
MPNPLEYAFWAGDANNNMSLDQLKRRQAVAAALAGQKRGYPKNLGEGIASLGSDIGDVLQERGLREREDAFNEKYGKQLGAAPPVTFGTGAPTRGAAPVAPPASVMPSGLPLGAGMPTAGATAPPPTAPPPAPGSAEVPASDDVKTRIALALLGDDVPGGAQVNPTVADQAAGGPSDPQLARRRAAIAGIESGGNYGAVGPATRGDRPYGKYQVMGANIGPWSQAALGQRLTPREFLADPVAQDRVFDHRFGGYADKYGERGAAQAWFAGEGGMRRPGARDVLGTSVADYGNRYEAALNGGGGGGGAPAGGGGRPIQLAARGDTGATMSDAPPISVSVDTENEETPTDIQPAPVRTQLAQAPRGVIAGSAPTVSSDMFSPNPMGAPARRADPGRASLTPVPPKTEQKLTDPGPQPEPPRQIPYSLRQKHMIDLLNDRNAPEWVKEQAKREFELEEKFRSDLVTRQETDYTNQRARWEKLTDERRKQEQEATKFQTEQLNARLAAQKAQHEMEVIAPLERALKEAEVSRQPGLAEKLRLEIEKQKLDYAKTQRELTTERVEIFGVPHDRTYDPEAGTWGPFRPSAGSPAEKPIEHVVNGEIWRLDRATGNYSKVGGPTDEKLTEKQMQTLKFFQRGLVAGSIVGEGLALRNLKDTAQGLVPIGGNYLVSPEYQSQRSAADTWMMAFLRDESGAVINADEMKRKYSLYFPQPGDSDQLIKEKARRRYYEERSLYDSMGDKKSSIDKFIEQRRTRKTDLPDGTEKRRGGKVIQRVIGGHWEDEADGWR